MARSLENIKDKFEKYKSNILFFENDDEFADFCIASYAIVKISEKGNLYYEGEFS